VTAKRNTIAAALLLLLSCQFAEAATDGLSETRYKRLSIDAVVRALTDTELKEVTTALEANPNDPKARTIVGLTYQRAGYVDMARAEYQKAWQLDRKFTDPLFLLTALEMKNNPKAAGAITDQALQYLNNDGKALTRLGALMQLYRKYDLAEKLFRRAVQLQPNSTELASARAFSLVRQQKYNEAIVEADKALQLKGAYGAAFAAKGEALLALNHPREAEDALEQAFHADPTDVHVNGLYTRALLRRDKFDQALEPMLFSLALTTDQPNVSLPLRVSLLQVLSHLNASQVDKTIETVSARLNDADMRANLHFALGDVFDRGGKFKLAIRQYEKGLVIKPDFARAYFRIGKDFELYYRNWDKANYYYKRAYELNPQDKEVRVRYGKSLQRIANRRNDLATQLKDLLNRAH
jgi:tetratricopeptide (TPR) repeat protein